VIRRGLLAAVGFALLLGFFATILRFQGTGVAREIERFAENPDKLRFLPPERVEPGEPATARGYRWDGREVERVWRKELHGKNVTLRSPRLNFESPEEIDSILIEIADRKGTAEFTLFWSDQPRLSQLAMSRNRRELRPVGGESSASFLVPGEDIYDFQFLGSEAAEPLLHYLFLRYPTEGASSVVFDSIRVVTKTERFATQLYGQGRLGLGGEIRDVLYVRTPGSIAYSTDLPTGASLLFGVSILDRRARVRYRVTVEADRRITAFDWLADETGTRRNFSVPLPAWKGAVITLLAESDRPDNVALWSTPMIVAPPRGSHRPNVVLYVIDALRADHLGCYGYPKRTSPFIDSLAKTGVLFRRAYSPASWTKPSVATLLTSLYPETHRLGARNYADPLPDSVTTLPEYLRRNGYITAQFSANPLSSTLSNLDKGFDYVFTPNSFQISNREIKQNKIHSDDLTDKILPWIEAHSRARFFLHVHSVDPHPPFLRAEMPSPVAGSGSGGDRYDAAVYFNDRQLQRLYSKLDELGLAQNTLLIVTADHGQAFGEHGQVGHGRSVYEEEVRIPLIMVHPGRLRPRVVDHPVHLVDIMPTVLAHCSVEAAPTRLQGRNILTGPQESLKDRRIFVSRFVYELDVFRGDFANNPSYAVVEGDWKLVVSEQEGRAEPRLELYDLAADPLERKDLSQKESRRVERLRAALREFLSRQREERLAFLLEHDSPANRIRILPRERGQAISPEVVDQLRTLGYIQ